MTKSEKQIALMQWILSMDEEAVTSLLEMMRNGPSPDKDRVPTVEGKETLPGKGKPNSGDTVKEWLEWAVKEGYNWAPSALAQADAKLITWPAKTLSTAVQYFEEWELTKEGEDFWGEIYYDLQNKVI